ncbi:MAG: fibrillarin-like rRNA/tRNA 2'-O-methyltransferase [Methanosarcinaceae archaeon]
MSPKEVSSGIFEITKRGGKQLATKNLVPGASVYGEILIEINGCEYRIWNPKRSKLAAMVIKKFSVPIAQDSKVLYLGAASGTTVSHVSDIVQNGIVYAVEFSPRTMRDLIGLCDLRPNIVPILADANRPQSYAHIVEEVDIIYQDVAQPNQSEIATVNAKRFLKKDGHLLLSIKARSIDTVANPKKVFKEEVRKLAHDFDVLDRRELVPFHDDHLGILACMKNNYELI